MVEVDDAASNGSYVSQIITTPNAWSIKQVKIDKECLGVTCSHGVVLQFRSGQQMGMPGFTGSEIHALLLVLDTELCESGTLHFRDIDCTTSTTEFEKKLNHYFIHYTLKHMKGSSKQTKEREDAFRLKVRHFSKKHAREKEKRATKRALKPRIKEQLNALADTVEVLTMDE